MLGGVYGVGKCRHCGGPVKDMGARYEITCINPECTGYLKFRPSQYLVKFTQGIYKKFSGPDRYARAHQFLGGLRAKVGDPETHGEFDIRDYSSAKPLSVTLLINQYLDKRKNHVDQGTLSKSQYRNIKNDLSKSQAVWGDANVKNIGYAEIEDFLDGLRCSSKTRANAKSALLGFFKWVKRRHQIPVPDMPDTPFELGYRTITDKKTQFEILEWIEKKFRSTEPRKWIAIKWLCTYGAFRPDDIRRVFERNVDYHSGRVTILRPTKQHSQKTIWLTDEDLELIRELPRGVPDMPLFRHDRGIGIVKSGDVFGENFLSRHVWKPACRALGINGLTLYAGTRHTSTTALQEANVSPEEIKKYFTQHGTNQAFERYMMPSKTKHLNLATLAAKKEDKKEASGEVIKLPNGAKMVPDGSK